MALKKSELMDLWESLSQGLDLRVKKQILAVTGRGGTSAARDYISANCLLTEYKKVVGVENYDMSKITDAKQIWDALPRAVAFRLRSFTPCLAARYDELQKYQQDELFDNKKWVATTKMNGSRGWLINYQGKTFLFSRNYSDKDCGLLEYWSNIHPSQCTKEYDGIFAVDVEILFDPGVDISGELEELGIETSSPLEAVVALLHTYSSSAQQIQERFLNKYNKQLVAFKLIHPLYFNGKNYLKRTLGEGQAVYDEVVKFGQELGYNLQSIKRCGGTREEKEIFLNTILDSGGEGVVFHNREGYYCTSENRSKTSFIKLKRTISQTNTMQGIGDTIDAFVTGLKLGSVGTANEGLISALQFSIHVLRPDGTSYQHVVANCPNVDLATKKMLTIPDATGLYPTSYLDQNGEEHWVSMNPEFDHLVAEVTGQALSAKSRALEHAALVRWRVERSPESCIYTQEFIDANTTNVGVTYHNR